jgi:AcrR family transcriptional regulator
MRGRSVAKLDPARPAATHDAGAAEAVRPAGRGGRKRDASRDAEILDAALEVLSEVGYAAMTIDEVAARVKASKATIYRRWPSKGHLVVDAAARMKSSQVALDRLPDTGTLRGDYLELFRVHSVEQADLTLRVMAGLASMISDERTLTDEVSAAVVEPWAAAQLVLMRRAVDRGEISASADIETASTVIPSIAAYRALVQQKPFERDFLISMLDGVVMPALLNAEYVRPAQ